MLVEPYKTMFTFQPFSSTNKPFEKLGRSSNFNYYNNFRLIHRVASRRIASLLLNPFLPLVARATRQRALLIRSWISFQFTLTVRNVTFVVRVFVCPFSRRFVSVAVIAASECFRFWLVVGGVLFPPRRRPFSILWITYL